MKLKMEEIIIDGKKHKTIEDIHLFLKKELEFPDYYGMNLDALWDCLTGWIDLPTKIVWINYSISEKKIGTEAIALKDLFIDAQKKIKGFSFKFEA